MRRIQTIGIAAALFALAAGGASAGTGSTLAAPGPCAEPRIEARGDPVQPIGTRGEPDAPFRRDARVLRSSPITVDTHPAPDQLPPSVEPRRDPLPPVGASGDPDTPFTPDTKVTTSDGDPKSTPDVLPPRVELRRDPVQPFDVAGGPREHFDPKDVAAPEVKRKPFSPPQPPGFARTPCTAPAPCEIEPRVVGTVVSEPTPDPGPGPIFPKR